jgi:hypothetical protein
MLAPMARRFVEPQPPQRRDRLVGTPPACCEVEPERVELLLGPADAYAKQDAAAAEAVERGERFGQEQRIALR